MQNEKVELAFCITMYNEEENLVQNTLKGIMQNLQAMFIDKDISEAKGGDVANTISVKSPKNIVVVLICDGFRGIATKPKVIEYARKYLNFDESLMEGFTRPRNPAESDANQLKFDMKGIDELYKDKSTKRVNNFIHLF
jgi:hypothetical protein